MADATEEEREVWRNHGASRVVLKTFDLRGNEAEVMVAGGGTVRLTRKERKWNQSLVADERLDPFTNGTLSPIHLIEGDEEMAELMSNPNLIGEEEMKELLAGNVDALVARLELVTNPMLLDRIMEIARDQDVSVKRMDVITARRQAIGPANVVEVRQV